MTVEGAVVAFHVDTSKVRILKANTRPPVSGSTGTAEPAAAGVSARSCLGIESRPPYGIPGCTKWVYVRNTCTSRVVAEIQRTEHLFSGILPQAFSVVVAP